MITRKADRMREDMHNIVQKGYLIFWTIFVLLFLALFAFFGLNIKKQEVKQGYEILTDYEVTTETDHSAPIRLRQVYTFRLQGVEGAYCGLMFYSAHQNVRIYLEDTCVYSMTADEIDISGRSPGCVWNEVSFSEEDNGKRVTIVLTPVYKSFINVTPDFYFGDRADIIQDVILSGLPMILLCIILIAFGIVYIMFLRCGLQRTDAEKTFLMLGYFAVQVGIWKLMDIPAVNLLFPGHPAFSQVSFMALMLMSVSFILFIKELYSTSDHFVWYFLCFAGFINMAITLLLQYLGIADMRQMLPVTHAIIMATTVTAIVMAVYDVKTGGWNREQKSNIWCLGCYFVGTLLDIMVYYSTNGQNTGLLGMFGPLLYICVLGMSAMRDVKTLMNIGIKAQKYEKMAYHDQLTGLYNRTAFTEHTGNLDFNAEKCIIVVMDLNNLKTCNDKLGHDKGDIYIKECARMIRENFDDIGRCYRMGGDEFHVLITNGDLHLCKQRIQALKDEVAQCDKVGHGFRMGIACGCKMFDRLLDYDINETARRADKVMYQEKFAMKEL